MNARHLAAAAAAVVLLAACTAGPAETSKSPGPPNPVTPTAAEKLCQTALPGLDVRSAGPMTSVGELRKYEMGPVATHPLADAFPNESADASGTYCWTATASGFEGYAVSAGGTAIKVGSSNLPSPTPSGAPITL